MPNDTDTIGSSSLLQSITRLLDASVSAGTGLDNLITVLSLLCLFSITSRNHPVNVPQQSQPAASNNPLHKLLGDLIKNSEGGGGGPPPDALMTLLPLLNNPQIKSKLNPATLGSILGLINNLGGGGQSQEKPKNEPKPEPKAEVKQENSRQAMEAPPKPIANEQLPPASPPRPQPAASAGGEDIEDLEGKNYGRYLNWKNNF